MPITSYTPEGQPPLTDEELAAQNIGGPAPIYPTPSGGPIDMEALKGAVAQTSPDSAKTPPASDATEAKSGRSPADEGDTTSDDETSPSGAKTDIKSLLDQYKATQANKPKEGYSDNLSDQALQGAMEQKSQMQLAANLGQMGQRIGAAIGRTKPDETMYAQLLQQAGQPVENILTGRKAANDTLQHQALVSSMADQKEMADPTSAISQTYRKFAKALGTPVDESTPASQLEKLTPLIEKISASRENAQARRDVAEQNAEFRRLMAGDKSTKDQAKAYSELTNKLESFRGNAAAQRASQDVLSADKALAIVKNKDPNTLTTQDLTLLATEMAKIASGSVPHEGTVHALMPNNLKTKAAELHNFLLSRPTDAQAGAYIRKNMSYLEDMKNVAQGTLNGFRHNIIKGYKGRVTPENFQEAMNTYGLNDVNKPTAITAKPTEERRMTKDGKTAVFDSNTKQFLRYE